MYYQKVSTTKSCVDICVNWVKSANITKDNLNLDYNTWHHIKIEMKNGVGLISNYTNSNTISFDSTDVNRFVFSLESLNDVIRYKNFIIFEV